MKFLNNENRYYYETLWLQSRRDLIGLALVTATAALDVDDTATAIRMIQRARTYADAPIDYGKYGDSNLTEAAESAASDAAMSTVPADLRLEPAGQLPTVSVAMGAGDDAFQQR